MESNLPATEPASPPLAFETSTGKGRPGTWAWVALALLLAASSYLRLGGVFENGITGSDTFQYWEIVHLWDQGQYVFNDDTKAYWQYFRPVFFGLNLLSLKVFGNHDYSLRLMIGIWETLNVFLVALVGFLYFRRAGPALLLATLYACIPSSILLSQVEMPHTYSATFSLGLLTCFLVAWNRRTSQEQSLSPTWLAASGFCGGLAALAHGDTTFFGPVMVLIITLDCLLRPLSWKNRILQTLAGCAAFTGAFFLPYLLAGLLLGFGPMIHALTSESNISERFAEERDRLGLYWQWLVDGPSQSLSPLLMILFYLSLGWKTVEAAIKRKFALQEFVPAITVVLFCLFFAFFFENIFRSRHFLVLNAFVLLFVFEGAYSALGRISSKLVLPGLVLLTGIAGAFAMEPKCKNIENNFRGINKKGPKAPHELIGNRVNTEARLLVAPYIAYYHRKQFQSKAYFGEDAVYLMDCGTGDLGEFLASEKIKFVVITKTIDQRIPKSTAKRYAQLGSCTGLDRATYTLEKETDFLHHFLEKVGARKLPMHSRYGELYELP